MTIVWFVVWLIGGHAAVRFDPVNWWAGTLMLALALDVNRTPMTKRARN